MKFGVREICDVVLKAKANQKVGNKIFYKNEPVIYFDTLKTSSMEGAATTVYAQGGRGNSRLVAWEGERTVTFTMEDALISAEGFMILSGAGLIEASGTNTIKVHQTERIVLNNENLNGNNIKLAYKPYKPEVDNGEDYIYVMSIDDNGEVTGEPRIYERNDILATTTKYYSKVNSIANGETYYKPTITSVSVTGASAAGKFIKKDDNTYVEVLSTADVTGTYYTIVAGDPIKVNAENDTSADEIKLQDLENGSIYKMTTSTATNDTWIQPRTRSSYLTSENDMAPLTVNKVILVDYYVERDSETQQIEITPDKFGGNYYLEASTLFRDTNGVDMPAEFIIPNCKIQSNFTFTMASSGDPSSFTFTMDAFPDYTRFDKTKKVLAAIQIIGTSTNIEEKSRDATKTYRTWDYTANKAADVTAG